MKTCMEHWWNYTDKEKLKYPEKELSQCHFIRHISQMDCPRLRPASSQYQQVPPHVPNPQRQFVYLIRATGDLIGPVVLLRLRKVIKTCNQHYGKRILKHSKRLQVTQLVQKSPLFYATRQVHTSLAILRHVNPFHCQLYLGSRESSDGK